MKVTTLRLFYTLILVAVVMAKNSSHLNGKIVGGRYSTINTKKFMASLRVQGIHFCGGFLISRRIVMSTGSCVNYIRLHGGIGFNDSNVFIGNVNFNARFARHVIKIYQIGYHPQYNPKNPIKSSGYDVGYVVLAETLPRSYTITAIALTRERVLPPLRTQIFGWGSREINDRQESHYDVPTSKLLNEIIVNITDVKICEDALGRKLKLNEICGIGFHEGETAAQGDAGGPLVRYRSNKVIGFTSIVNIMAHKHPIVFVRAESFVDYCKELIDTFPESEPTLCHDGSNEPSIDNQVCDLPVLNKNCKRLRDPDDGNVDLPDLNEPLDVEF